jgi:Xaa-Pro aminopeptidase
MSSRSERLLAVMSGAGVELLLVTELTGVRYLTGYTGSNGLALVGPDTRRFVTDFRYVEQAAEEVDPQFERVRAPQDLLQAVPEALPENAKAVRLGFDDAHTSVREHKRLRSLLPDRVELVPAGGLVEELRRIKEPVEVERIAAASRIADEALEAVLATGLTGRTEREVSLQLETSMRERGAEAASFDSIVAAGAHGALPHAQPREVAIQRGDLVVFDWGAVYEGYHSDCTRTVAVGDVESEAREAYELVLSAQLAGLGAVRAGMAGQEADRTAREVIEQAGHGDHYGHGLGHGVGLEIHEGPRLSQRSEDRLVTGNVVTVEPGIYLPGRFGIRIEDLVLVTDDGCRILTEIPKDFRIVD